MKFIARNGSQSSVYDIKKEYKCAGYAEWLDAGLYKNLKKFIYNEIINPTLTSTNRDSTSRLVIHRMSGVLSIDKIPSSTALKDLVYLQIHISQLLTAAGYIVNLSEIKQHDDLTISYIIYLKPSIMLEKVDGKIDQRFGNIHTEIKICDGKLDFFKIISHRYNDRNYLQGLEFIDLLKMLFDPNAM